MEIIHPILMQRDIGHKLIFIVQLSYIIGFFFLLENMAVDWSSNELEAETDAIQRPIEPNTIKIATIAIKHGSIAIKHGV